MAILNTHFHILVDHLSCQILCSHIEYASNVIYIDRHIRNLLTFCQYTITKLRCGFIALFLLFEKKGQVIPYKKFRKTASKNKE